MACWLVSCAVSAWLLMLASSLVSAHELRPSVVTVELSEPSRIQVTMTANLEALMAGIGPEHKDTKDAPEAERYDQLRRLPSAALRQRFEAFSPRWLTDLGLTIDGGPTALTIAAVAIPDVGDLALARISTVKLSGPVPPGATRFGWSYPAAFGATVLRVKRAGSSELETDWLRDGATRADVPFAAPATKRALAAFSEYVVLGFTHIVPGGLDHILFVLGLFFLSTLLKPLLVQATAFTVAHSITLALGLYGVVEVSPRIVEPLIALSIVFVAVENLLTERMMWWRPFVVFGFGLLHGLGFAGILQELGLPPSQYVVGLFGFNVGVEFGQLAVISVAWLTTAYWFADRSWYRARIVLPASGAIALMGLFWAVERVWFA